MTTVTAGTTAAVYSHLNSTITVTPGFSVVYHATDRKGDRMFGDTKNAAFSVDLTPGATLYIQAIGLDATYTSTLDLIAPDSSVYSLSEVSPVVEATATATAFTGACEFGGFVVRSESGGTADVTIYDNTSATGTAIMTVANVTTGAYLWLGDHATAGVGTNGRRANTTGCHVVISGTATIDVLVG